MLMCLYLSPRVIRFILSQKPKVYQAITLLTMYLASYIISLWFFVIGHLAYASNKKNNIEHIKNQTHISSFKLPIIINEEIWSTTFWWSKTCNSSASIDKNQAKKKKHQLINGRHIIRVQSKPNGQMIKCGTNRQYWKNKIQTKLDNEVIKVVRKTQ